MTCVTTPESARHVLTPPETAAAISRATGQEVPYVRIPLEAVRARSEEAARGIQPLNDSPYPLVDIAPLRALHPGLLTFDAWLNAGGATRLKALLSA